MARPRRVRTTDSRHGLPIAPNLLDRNFTATAPNRIWLADITYGAPRPERSGKRMSGMH
jgi:transposase InsO family protein